MAIIGEQVNGGCTAFHCGPNRGDGIASVIAQHPAAATAKQEARRRAIEIRNEKLRECRKLKCPTKGEKNCRVKDVVQVYSGAPILRVSQYLKAVKEWRVMYVVKWRYRAKCRAPKG